MIRSAASALWAFVYSHIVANTEVRTGIVGGGSALAVITLPQWMIDVADVIKILSPYGGAIIMLLTIWFMLFPRKRKGDSNGH